MICLLTLIRLGFFKLLFLGERQYDLPPFIFQDEIIQYKYNMTQLLNNCWHHLLTLYVLYTDVISFLQQVNIKKSEKLPKFVKKIFMSHERRDEFQWNFFEKCHLYTYNNIKSHQISGLHPLSRKHNFGKITWGVKVTPQLF